jgi:hypothetical protein
MLNAKKNLSQRLIIKNTVLMSVAVLQQIEELWKSIMRKKQSEMVQPGHAQSVSLS